MGRIEKCPILKIEHYDRVPKNISHFGGTNNIFVPVVVRNDFLN